MAKRFSTTENMQRHKQAACTLQTTWRPNIAQHKQQVHHMSSQHRAKYHDMDSVLVTDVTCNGTTITVREFQNGEGFFKSHQVQVPRVQQPDVPSDQDSSADHEIDVNDSDFLPTATELDPGSVFDSTEQKETVAAPKADSGSICSKGRTTNQTRTHVIRRKMSSAAGTVKRKPKRRGKIFWCKVMNCNELSFDNESDRDHHWQRHLEQEPEKRKQKAQRMTQGGMEDELS